MDADAYEQARAVIRQELRATEWLLGNSASELAGVDDYRGLLVVLEHLELTLGTGDVISKRAVVDILVEHVDVAGPVPTIVFHTPFSELLKEGGSHRPAQH
jgi:hypothetical protein